MERTIAGLDCAGRILISDRAHLVFDFHQIVDGLKEIELGKSKYVHNLETKPFILQLMLEFF